MLPPNQDIIRKSIGNFKSALSVSGYSSYAEYLRSDHWRNFKAMYRKTSLPQHCVVCGNPNYILHHWNYNRCGRELFRDVIPLCDTHHAQIHKWGNSNNQPVCYVIAALQMCFGISKEESHRIFKQFKGYKAVKCETGSVNKPTGNRSTQQSQHSGRVIMGSYIEGVHVSTSIARYARKFGINAKGKRPHEIVEEAEGLILKKDDALLRMHNMTVFDASTHERARSSDQQPKNHHSVIARLTDQRLPIFGDDDDNLSDLMRMAETQKDVTIDAMRMRELVMELRRIRKELRTRNG